MFSYYPQSYSPLSSFSQPRRRSYYPSAEEQYQLALAQEQECRQRAAQEAELQRRRKQAYLEEMNRLYGGRQYSTRRPASYSWFGPDYEEEDEGEDEYAAIMRERAQQQQRRRMPAQQARAPTARRAEPIQEPLPEPTQPKKELRHPKSPSPKPKVEAIPTPPLTPPTIPPSLPTPDLNAAAQTIQNHWRAYHTRSKALRDISAIRSRFNNLRESFTFPSSLDFAPTSTSTLSSVPKLLYTETNKPLHAYDHALTMLLTDVDGVQSGGDVIVREARKKLVRDIEAVLEGLDVEKAKFWTAVQPREVEVAVPDIGTEVQSEAPAAVEDGDDEIVVDELSSAVSTPLPESDSEADSDEDYDFLSATSDDDMDVEERL